MQLDALISQSTAVVFASVSTIDGRNFTQATTKGDISGPRISALTSSMLALGESLVRESALGSCQYSALSANGGSIVLVRTPTARPAYTLLYGGYLWRLMTDDSA
ncbi:MAG: hypothetical protein ABI222_02180 [Opitutaceae bacterium]